ncbi:unnamed protein product [Prorocentrum cordatum]|uniref:Uncharacterized protein n=1 Tax=Prorocentrum cordatum TaxID=2364126 RepID=A0ABN9TIS5_9DINO|nr:unnamed protein product [Polarella glacialis]
MRALPASLPVRRPGPSCGSSGRARRRRVGCGLLRRAPSCASGPRRTLPDLSSDPTGTCQRNGRGPGGGGGGGWEEEEGEGEGEGGRRRKSKRLRNAPCCLRATACSDVRGVRRKVLPETGRLCDSLVFVKHYRLTAGSRYGSPLALGTRRQRVTAVRSHATAAPRPTG